jgi:hypothetical protein
LYSKDLRRTKSCRKEWRTNRVRGGRGMTDKDLKLLKKISKNRVVIYVDYILLVIVWITSIGYYASLGPYMTDQIIPTAFTAVLVFDIIHRKRELRLYDLAEFNFKEKMGSLMKKGVK